MFINEFISKIGKYELLNRLPFPISFSRGVHDEYRFNNVTSTVTSTRD